MKPKNKKGKKLKPCKVCYDPYCNGTIHYKLSK